MCRPFVVKEKDVEGPKRPDMATAEATERGYWEAGLWSYISTALGHFQSILHPIKNHTFLCRWEHDVICAWQESL